MSDNQSDHPSEPPSRKRPRVDSPPASPVEQGHNARRRGAGFIFTTPESNILLVQDRGSQKWGFCKGHVEEYDADTLATAIREAREEIGVEPGADYQIASEKFRITDYDFFYAVLSTPVEALRLQASEVSAVRTVSPTELIAAVTADENSFNRYVRAWVRIISGLM
jgi:8-oxo-dGTP pyrophosphatase MutT (NUDIX family)